MTSPSKAFSPGSSRGLDARRLEKPLMTDEGFNDEASEGAQASNDYIFTE
jgi:hypothetical protein